MSVRLALVLSILLAAAMPSRLAAHDGHDHGAPPTPVSTTIAPRVDASSDIFELIGVLRAGKLTIYVDRFTTNEPVSDAEVEVETPSGTLKSIRGADGTFVLDASWAKAGANLDLIFTVTAGTDLDVLTGTLKVPPDAPATAAPTQTSWLFASAVAKGLKERVASYDPALPAVAIAAFLAGLLVSRRRKGAVTGLIVLSGSVALALAVVPSAHADTPLANQSAVDLAQRLPDGAVFVPKATQHILSVRTIMAKPEEHRRAVSLPGRVIPDPSASGSVQTSVTGRLSPPQGGFPRLGQRVKAGDVLALVQPSISAADVTTQQQQARELDQQLALVQRRLERFRAIQNIVARSQIEDAELELAGLKVRRANLERAPRATERLLAPVDGVIASAAATPGQVVEVNAMIFQIINPDRLWVEALTFDALAGAKTGTARLSDGQSVKLDYQGTGFADRNQAIPIHFAVAESTKGLRLGTLLTVVAETEEVRSGIAIPRAAVVRAGNGQMIVYEHANAERFVPREVRVEALDATRMLVISGLEPNKRIVTGGAELLNQIR
ncbi:MAG: efflux RND transporter periplasmic adaptor subunit [Bosea sp. (in: a-proteobacteria)]